MKLITKEVSNPEKKFWIWDEKITNKQDGRIYPHNTTNVGSGKSVAVYQLSESGKEEQIAQLEIPDYKKLGGVLLARKRDMFGLYVYR